MALRFKAALTATVSLLAVPAWAGEADDQRVAELGEKLVEYNQKAYGEDADEDGGRKPATRLWSVKPEAQIARADYYSELRGELGEIDQAKQILDNVVSLPLEELRTAYERVSETIEGRPDCAELGSLLVSTGEAEEAINYLTMALDANPRDLDVRYSRGIALRETGRVEEGLAEIASVSAAREELTRADRIVDSIDPTRPQVPERIQIGEIYLNHGSFKTSEFWLLSALSHDHENPRALELLIRLYTDWEELNPEFREQQASNYRRQLQSLALDSSDRIESGEKTDEAQQ